MKIRHILPGFGRIPSDPAAGAMSGIVGVAYNLAREQAAGGQEVELFGLAEPGARGNCETRSHGVRVTAVRPWRMLRLGGYDYRYFAPVAWRLLARGRAGIHHVYSNPYHLALGKAARRVLHYQTPVSEPAPAYQRAVRQADAVICCSDFIRTQFLRHVDYPEERVHLVYNGVDLGRFRPGDRAASRARLGIPGEEAVILFVGQVNEDKGLLHLVRALRALAPDHAARLVVAGSSSLWGGAERRAERSAGQTPYERQVAAEAQGLNVTFLGKVTQAEIPQVYQAADIFVCPSVWDDPSPLVNLEAMATGLPVVGTRAGGIPEIVVDGTTGLIVPPADAAALGAALRTLLGNPQLCRTLGEAGQKRSTAFSWSAIAAEVDRVYVGVGQHV